MDSLEDSLDLTRDGKVVDCGLFDWCPIVAKDTLIIRVSITRDRDDIVHDSGTSISFFIIGVVTVGEDLLAASFHGSDLGHI